MAESNIKTLIAVRDALEQGREPEINIAGEEPGKFILNPLFMLLADSGSAEKFNRLFSAMDGKMLYNFDLNAFIVYFMLKGKNEDVICRMIEVNNSGRNRTPTFFYGSRDIQIPEMIEAANALGYRKVLRSAAADSTVECLAEMVLKAVKNNDTELIRDLTDNGELLAVKDYSAAADPYGFGSPFRYDPFSGRNYDNDCLLFMLLDRCFVHDENIFRTLPDEWAPSPEEIFSAFGKLRGESAASALRFCAGEKPESFADISGNIIYRNTDIGIPAYFSFERSEPDDEERLNAGKNVSENIRRLKELSRLMSEAGIKMPSAAEILEERLYGCEDGYEALIDIFLPIFPEKARFSSPYLRKEHIDRIREGYRGDMIFSLDKCRSFFFDDRDYKFSYMKMICENMKAEYAFSPEIDENSLLAGMLDREMCGPLRVLFGNGCFDRRTTDLILEYCVERKLYKVINMVSRLKLGY